MTVSAAAMVEAAIRWSPDCPDCYLDTARGEGSISNEEFDAAVTLLWEQGYESRWVLV